MQTKIFKTISILLLGLSGLSYAEDTIRVGWIGAMSGPISKYGAYQSAQLAEETINSSGGIQGKKLELIYEDGKGEGLSAVKAAQKLINIDKVKFILGGHCSPESLAIAPIVEKAKVLMLAGMTSSPLLTNSGDYVFRVTAVSTQHADMLASYALKDLDLKNIAVLYEETDYARPPAEHFAELIKSSDAKLVNIESYNPGETDFRTILARFKINHIDGLYLGVQAPETAVLILRQLKVLQINATIFGNEITANAVNAFPKEKKLFEGLIFAEPPFNTENPETKKFITNYKNKFHLDSLPYGFWSAETYDSVMLLAETMKKCGEDVEEVKKCLYNTKNYPGVSAPLSIDQNGDSTREYVLKIIKDGNAKPLDNIK